MTDAQLTFYSSWASIIGLFISIMSLLYVRSIKSNIIKFRRKQRLKQIIDAIMRIPDDAVPLSTTSLSKIDSLKRNIPCHFWHHLSPKGKLIVQLHKAIDSGDIITIKELIDDVNSFSDEI